MPNPPLTHSISYNGKTFAIMSRELFGGFFCCKTVHFSSTSTQQSPLGEPGSPAPLPLLYQHSLGEADLSLTTRKSFQGRDSPRAGEAGWPGTRAAASRGLPGSWATSCPRAARLARLLRRLRQPQLRPASTPCPRQRCRSLRRASWKAGGKMVL